MAVAVMEFEKYEGAGDNFVFVDNRNGKYDHILSQQETVKKICDRNFGVGANGVIEMRGHSKYAFENGVLHQFGKRKSDVRKRE